MEAINFNPKYERKKKFKKIENLRWLFKVKNIDVANLPSLRPMDMSMLIVYPHKNT